MRSRDASKIFINTDRRSNTIRGLQRKEVDGVIKIISLNITCESIGISQPTFNHAIRRGFISTDTANKLADNGVDIRLFEETEEEKKKRLAK